MVKTRSKKTVKKTAPELYEDVYKKNFSFGRNWKNLLTKMNKERVDNATKSLQDFLSTKSLKGKDFLDLGCGSGLFSLAAVKMGARRVISVDVDESSLECARMLRSKFKVSELQWQVLEGSALDAKLASKLPAKEFDIVYSWGVLHHTGDMNAALNNAGKLVKKNGLLYVAIYNDFKGLPFSSKTWVKIKRMYNKRGKIGKAAMKSAYTSIIIAGLIAYGRNPINYIKNYSKQTVRGMDFFVDIEDWMGGYPYEYASTEEIKAFYKKRGFEQKKVKTTPREGCNEFLFVRKR